MSIAERPKSKSSIRSKGATGRTNVKVQIKMPDALDPTKRRVKRTAKVVDQRAGGTKTPNTRNAEPSIAARADQDNATPLRNMSAIDFYDKLIQAKDNRSRIDSWFYRNPGLFPSPSSNSGASTKSPPPPPFAIKGSVEKIQAMITSKQQSLDMESCSKIDMAKDNTAEHRKDSPTAEKASSISPTGPTKKSIEGEDQSKK